MAAVVEPGSIPFTGSAAVARMMQRWNYQEGSGLGARGQGIVVPIQATLRRHKGGIGHREDEERETYDNGLDAPAPPKPTEVELQQWLELSRTLRLEEECCKKVLALLRDMKRQGDGSAETAKALAAIARSRKVFQRKNLKPGMWKATLPAATTRYIIEQVITPKMAVDAVEWEPAWDAECYHWLQHLIPLIGHMPECLYGVVESKINIDDYDAILPWKKYLSPAQWDDFSRRRIVPKLAQWLRGLRVTPPKQTDSSFRFVMFWAPLVRTEDVVSMLEEFFFDKWEGALRHWLLAATPPLAEATAWCNAWKKLFRTELLADERVSARLEAGFAVLDREAQDRGTSLVDFI